MCIRDRYYGTPAPGTYARVSCCPARTAGRRTWHGSTVPGLGARRAGGPVSPADSRSPATVNAGAR
eukprot:578202-Hanusia_phi.AAC.1